MNIKAFKGTFFQIGEQQGEIYKANGMSFDHVEIDSVLYKNQLEVYEKYYPELLEEFRGMAKRGNFDEEKLIYDFITSQIFYYRKRFGLDKACTIFGYKAQNTLFIGRNYDWIPEAEKLFGVYKVFNTQRNAFMAVSDMGIGSPATAKREYLYYDPIDAINDKGLFIGLTFAYADEWSYGLSSMHMIKIIAETCATVQDAVQVFEKTPLCCPKNFFIADKNGDMVIIEHTSKKFKTLYPKEDILIQTNHYVDSELAKEDTVLKRHPIHNTFLRYDETSQKIRSEKHDFQQESVIQILGQPGSHVCQNFPNVRTIWTLALDMTNRKYKIYWDISGKRKTQTLDI